jgi:hypothetical protein
VCGGDYGDDYERDRALAVARSVTERLGTADR